MFRPALLAAALLLALTMPAHADTPFPVSRCINLSNALEAPREGEWGYTIQRAHITDIAAAGFDTVRLPVKASAHLRAGKLDPAFLARIDQVIGWAEAANLNVILDVHHFDDLNEDPARHSDTLVSIWDQFSIHFAGHPPTLVFELLNEPHTNLTTPLLIPLYDRIIDRIRTRHPDRWIITGGGNWNALDDLAALPPPPAYVARTFHYYSPFEFTHQLAPWTGLDLPARSWGTEADRAALAADIASAPATHPVFLGEFGVYRGADPTARTDWIRATRTAAENAGLAWCHWGFAADFRAYDADSRTWNADILDALID